MEGDKGQWWIGLIQVCYIWNKVKTFVNATMYPHPVQKPKKKKKSWDKYKKIIQSNWLWEFFNLIKTTTL
jgi:hypothetical protein